MADHVPKRNRAAIVNKLTESAGALGYKGEEVRKFVDHELKAVAEQEREQREARRMRAKEAQEVEERRLAVWTTEQEAERERATRDEEAAEAGAVRLKEKEEQQIRVQGRQYEGLEDAIAAATGRITYQGSQSARGCRRRTCINQKEACPKREAEAEKAARAMGQTEAIKAIERKRVQLEIDLQKAKQRAAQAQRLGARGNDDETDDQARHIRYKAERPKIPGIQWR